MNHNLTWKVNQKKKAAEAAKKLEQEQEDAFLQKQFEDASKKFDVNNPNYEQTDAYKARKNILDDLLAQAISTGLTKSGLEAQANQATAFNNALTGTQSVNANQGANMWSSVAGQGADNNLASVIAGKYNQQGQLGMQQNRNANQQALNTISSEDAARKQAYKDKATSGYVDLGTEAVNYNQNLGLLKQASLYNTKAARGV